MRFNATIEQPSTRKNYLTFHFIVGPHTRAASALLPPRWGRMDPLDRKMSRGAQLENHRLFTTCCLFKSKRFRTDASALIASLRQQQPNPTSVAGCIHPWTDAVNWSLSILDLSHFLWNDAPILWPFISTQLLKKSNQIKSNQKIQLNQWGRLDSGTKKLVLIRSVNSIRKRRRAVANPPIWQMPSTPPTDRKSVSRPLSLSFFYL